MGSCVLRFATPDRRHATRSLTEAGPPARGFRLARRHAGAVAGAGRKKNPRPRLAGMAANDRVLAVLSSPARSGLRGAPWRMEPERAALGV